MSTWPSATSATIRSESTSSESSTARRMLPAIRDATACAASSSSAPTGPTSSGSISPLRPGGLLGPHPSDGVEHLARNLRLGRARDRLVAAAPDDRDLVRVDLEADVGAGDVVDHQKVQPLALELGAADRYRVRAMLRREA